jgi:hypothetical protein
VTDHGPLRVTMAGLIAGAGFASGDRVVIGHWWRSPVGPFTDLMWATPDGLKVLYAPDHRVVRFVTSVYRFDRIEAVPFRTEVGERSLRVEAGDRTVELTGGRGVRVPLPTRRPPWVTRRLEAPIARALLGVHTFGVSPTGVREWYQASWWRAVRRGTAVAGGVDLGAVGPVEPAIGFGFTEPPRRASIVHLRTVLEDTTGRLGALLARGEGIDQGTGSAAGRHRSP